MMAGEKKILKILHFGILGRLSVQETFVLYGLIQRFNYEMCRFIVDEKRKESNDSDCND